MSTPSPPLVVTQAGNVTVVRLAQPLILTGDTAEAVGDQLLRLADEGRTNILFNFADVRSLTSLMIGKLMILNKRLTAAGGRLALCDFQPDVRELLDVVGLPRVISVYPLEQSALDSFGG